MRVSFRMTAFAVALVALIAVRPVGAEDYPSRPITLIAPWPPGGAVDTICRILGAKLTERLKANVIIENRPGAGSVLGVAATARAAPDASGGPGSPHHLYTELLKSMTGMQMLHVPYKGSAPALSDVIAGHIPLMLGDVVAALPLVRDGKLRALGVTSLTRVPSAPELPTIAETVPGYEGVGWVMVVAPAHTPKPIVDRLHAELKAIVALPEVGRQLIELGTIPLDSPPPDEQQRFIDREILRWAPVVQQAGIAGTQ
jgi:tripartite-type tricarboxylate transporter receptor subunit TctC